MPETRVQGPDGQEYVFPEGVTQEEMRAAMQKRYSTPEQDRITARAKADGLPAPNFNAQPNPENQTGAVQGFAGSVDRLVDSFENFNPQPDAGIKSPADAFLFKGVNALTGGGLQRAGNEVYEGTVQENFGDRAVKASDSFPVGATAGQMTGMGAQLLPAQRAASLAKNVPGVKQVVDAAGKTRVGSYLGRLAAGSAAWAGEGALQGATTLAEENSAYTGERPTLGDRASLAGDMATMNLGDVGVETPYLKSVPINVLGPVGTSIVNRAGVMSRTGGASATPKNVRESVQSATGRLSGGPEQMRAVAEVIDTELAGGLRPQAISAVHRILKHSGLSDTDIRALNTEVSQRMQAGSGSAASRKTIGQLYVEILEETKPQAAENIVAVLRERRLNVRRNDNSAGIIRAGTRDLRDSQKEFLDHSASKNLGENTRIGAKEQVEELQKEISSEYERILAAAPTTGPGADGLRTILKADPSRASVLRRKAKNAGMSVEQYIDAKPYEAAHWMRSRLSKDARSASGRERGDLLDSVSQIDEVLDSFDDYAATKRAWGTEQGVLNAREFGDKLFGGANSSLMNNPGMRAELVESFNTLTDREKQVALVSIRDAALAKMQGGPAGQPARLTSITSDAAIDFFEQVGAKPFADDLLAIKNEQGFLNSFDPNANSRTAPNQQATAQAPALYNSKVANAVDNATPGTMLGEGALMAFAPHYQGLYAAYRGSRMLADTAFGTRPQTLEDMTRFLMARPRAANHASQTPQGSLPKGEPSAAAAMESALAKPKAEEPVQNGMLSNGAFTDTIAGAGLGSVSGNFVDYNQDGVIDQKDVAIGAAGGAVGLRTGRKVAQRATKSRPAGMLQYEQARLRVMNANPDLQPGSAEYQSAVMAELKSAGYGGTQSRDLKRALAPEVDTTGIPEYRLRGVKPEDQWKVVVSQKLGQDGNPSQGHLPSGQLIDLARTPEEQAHAVFNGINTLKKQMGMTDDEAFQAIREATTATVTKDDVAKLLLEGDEVEDVYRMHQWLFTGDDAATLTPEQLQRAMADLPPDMMPAGTLPMDEASRMARAREMGFDTEQTLYHGTVREGFNDTTDITQFDPSRTGNRWNADREGFFFTSDPSEAGYYAKADSTFRRTPDEDMREAAIYPVHVRTQKPLKVKTPANEGNISYWDDNNTRLIEQAKAEGADSIVLQEPSGRTMTVVFDPKNIRSKYAKFDPELSDSPIITNGFGGGVERRRTQNKIRDGLQDMGGRARAPAGQRPASIGQTGDELRQSPLIADEAPTGITPDAEDAFSARNMLTEQLIADGMDPQQARFIAENMDDGAVAALSPGEMAQARGRYPGGDYGTTGDGGGGILGLMGAGGAAGLWAALSGGQKKEEPNPLSQILASADQATRSGRGLPETPSMKPQDAMTALLERPEPEIDPTEVTPEEKARGVMLKRVEEDGTVYEFVNGQWKRAS